MIRVAFAFVVVVALVAMYGTKPTKEGCMDAGYSPAHCSAFTAEKEH